MVLPLFTSLTGSRPYTMNVEGQLYGVEELRVTKTRSVRLTISGHSSCYQCSLPVSQGQYWFNNLKVENAAKVEISSNSRNVKTQSVTLHIQSLNLQGSSAVNADVLNMFSDVMKIQCDAKIDSSSQGYPAYQGPGYRSGCSSSAGAGHGGDGGYGERWGCSKCKQYSKYLACCLMSSRCL